MLRLRFQVSRRRRCVVVTSLAWMMISPTMTITNCVPDASAILRKRCCIPGHHPSMLERQEVMAKIYVHRSSAASGELRWWEGSRPGRSKDFLSHQDHQLGPCLHGWGQIEWEEGSLGPLSQPPLPWGSSISLSGAPTSALLR